MFQYIYPRFQVKHLLRIEMLEELRDYPKDFLELLFSGYGNGILTGCDISWDNGNLVVGPGIVNYDNRIYMMKKPYYLKCDAENQLRYLKIQILEELQEPNQTVGRGRLVLSAVPVDSSCEMELCRFQLQEGARLRNTYENYEDYSTRYDTVNIIYMPYIIGGEPSLHPNILMQYAKEVMRNKSDNPYDINFSMSILAVNGSISKECIKEYLYVCGVQLKGTDNKSLYEGLLNVLKEHNGDKKNKEAERKGKSIMLL